MALQLLEILHRHGASLVFSGHFHQNHLVHSDEFGVTNIITTSASSVQIGKDSNGFRLVRVQKDAVQHKFFALGEMPEKLDSWSA